MKYAVYLSPDSPDLFMFVNSDNVKINIRPIFSFKVYWHAWECDSDGHIMEDSIGRRYLVLTNHGSMYIADEQEALAKIEEYQEAIRETQKAIYLLHP